MLGAIAGDIIGSEYEISNIKNKEFNLFSLKSRYTDDSVMTCAISKACSEYVKNKNKKDFEINVINYMRTLGRIHINAGYGGTFIKWLLCEKPIPYNSWGNGSAMRVSPIAWVSENLDECLELAEISSSVTHNHPEGIKGAKAIAAATFLAKSGASKKEIFEYISQKYYDLKFNIDDIRRDYKFDVSCQGSVPQAIKAFLEGNSFEDVIRNAISLGGDSDTIAAMAGAIAEAYYGIPDEIEFKAKQYLSNDLLEIVEDFNLLIQKNHSMKI